MGATVADGEPERLTFETNALVFLLTNSARLTEPAHEGGRLVSSDAAFDELRGIVRIW